jgi:anti-anti-sigma factor
MVTKMTDAGHLGIESKVEDGVGRVRLRGELDLDGAASVTDRVAALADQGASAVEVDAQGLTFLDSSGLRALLSAREQLENSGVAFRVTAASQAVERVLDMTGTRALLTGA